MNDRDPIITFAMKAAVIVMAVLVASITIMDFAHPWQIQGRRGHYWVLTPDVLKEA